VGVWHLKTQRIDTKEFQSVGERGGITCFAPLVVSGSQSEVRQDLSDAIIGKVVKLEGVVDSFFLRFEAS